MPAEKQTYPTNRLLLSLEQFFEITLATDPFTFEQLEEIGASLNCAQAAILARAYGSQSRPERRMAHMAEATRNSTLELANELLSNIRELEAQGRADTKH